MATLKQNLQEAERFFVGYEMDKFDETLVKISAEATLQSLNADSESAMKIALLQILNPSNPIDAETRMSRLIQLWKKSQSFSSPSEIQFAIYFSLIEGLNIEADQVVVMEDVNLSLQNGYSLMMGVDPLEKMERPLFWDLVPRFSSKLSMCDHPLFEDSVKYIVTHFDGEQGSIDGVKAKVQLVYHHMKNKSPKAVKVAQEIVADWKRIRGESDPMMKSYEDLLARAMMTSGDDRMALDLAEKALVAEGQFMNPSSLFAHVEVFVRAERWRDLEKLYRKIINLCHAYRMDESMELTNARMGLSRLLYLKLNAPDEAMTVADECIQMYEKFMSLPDGNLTMGGYMAAVDALFNYAEMSLQQIKRLERSQQLLELFTPLFVKWEPEESFKLVNLSYIKGDVAVRLGNIRSAIDHYKQTKTRLLLSVEPDHPKIHELDSLITDLESR